MDRAGAIQAALDRIHGDAAAARAAASPRKAGRPKTYKEMTEDELLTALNRVAYAQPYADRKDRMTMQDHQEARDYQTKIKIKQELQARAA